jgi:hypothetical protein
MSRLRLTVLAAAGTAVAVVLAIAFAPRTGAHSNEPPPPLGTKTSAKVTRMLGKMSAARIEHYALVGFGTRTRCPRRPTRTAGIGAARDWIFSAVPAVRRDARAGA